MRIEITLERSLRDKVKVKVLKIYPEYIVKFYHNNIDAIPQNNQRKR